MAAAVSLGNLIKSELTPSQTFSFFGMSFDTRSMLVFPYRKRIVTVLSSIARLRLQSRFSEAVGVAPWYDGGPGASESCLLSFPDPCGLTAMAPFCLVRQCISYGRSLLVCPCRLGFFTQVFKQLCYSSGVWAFVSGSIWTPGHDAVSPLGASRSGYDGGRFLWFLHQSDQIRVFLAAHFPVPGDIF